MKLKNRHAFELSLSPEYLVVNREEAQRQISHFKLGDTTFRHASSSSSDLTCTSAKSSVCVCVCLRLILAKLARLTGLLIGRPVEPAG